MTYCITHATVQYAFLITERDQFDTAEEVLQHALMSTVFQKRTTQDSLRLAIIGAKLHFGSRGHLTDCIIQRVRCMLENPVLYWNIADD